jgi:hypothetical protein
VHFAKNRCSHKNDLFLKKNKGYILENRFLSFFEALSVKYLDVMNPNNITYKRVYFTSPKASSVRRNEFDNWMSLVKNISKKKTVLHHIYY